MATGLDYANWFHRGGEFFERIISDIYRARVSPGSTVLDVGANHGQHTIPLAEVVGRNGRVLAYEALPSVALELREATRHLPQVSVLNVAVSDRRGRSAFHWVTAATAYSGLRRQELPAGLSETIREIDVPTERIDDRLRRRWPAFRRDRVRFIKIDIEGGEYHALCGAREVLRRDMPLLVFENARQRAANWYGYTRDDYLGLFRSLGYHLYDLFGRRLTEAEWDRDQIPWYSVAAPAGSDDDRFVRLVLPLVIRNTSTL